MTQPVTQRTTSSESPLTRYNTSPILFCETLLSSSNGIRSVGDFHRKEDMEIAVAVGVVVKVNNLQTHDHPPVAMDTPETEIEDTVARGIVGSGRQ